MFGLKLFTKTKTKKFASDKDRKQYYAIQGYYKKKAVAKSRLVQGLALAKSIKEAEESYWLDYGTYTTNLAELDMDVKPYYISSSDDFSRNFLPNGEVVLIAINAFGYIEDRVEVYSPDRGGISFYFEHGKKTSFNMAGKRVCFGSTAVYMDACISMGGEYNNHSGNYILP